MRGASHASSRHTPSTRDARVSRRTLPVGTAFRSDVPARLDRLPWSRWHLKVVVALGITWILDGLEATMVGAVATVLGERETLNLTASQIGLAGSLYLVGAIVGALVFGRLTDQFGRKRLFLVTLALYLSATVATGLSVGFYSFVFFRALTGAGIGGEYAAINSAIDELIPARVRGRVDLAINGTFWIGTTIGALSTIVLLDQRYLSHAIGWRVCFLFGAVLGLAIMLVRRHIPESPRWLLLHGHVERAALVVRSIEDEVEREKPVDQPAEHSELIVHGTVSFRAIARTLFVRHRRRSFLGLTLVVAQAFAYNGVFFTYAMVLGTFFGVRPERVGWYIVPFALANAVGPLMLGRFFDTIGRRVMIPATYGGTALLLACAATLFGQAALSLTQMTLLIAAVAFVASTAASSAYLTVSELFPVELRGMAIALFYAIGTGIGGVTAPTIFGRLLERGTRQSVALGYWIAAVLMGIGAIVAWIYAVAAEGKSLEELADRVDA
jgi:MFS family permease